MNAGFKIGERVEQPGLNCGNALHKPYPRRKRTYPGGMAAEQALTDADAIVMGEPHAYPKWAWRYLTA